MDSIHHCIWRHRLTVRTRDSHSRNRSSILRDATKSKINKTFHRNVGVFFIVKILCLKKSPFQGIESR